MTNRVAKLLSMLTPKRRWAQFSLATLFVVVTAFGLAFGVVTKRGHRQRDTIAFVRSLGGTVAYDYQYDPHDAFEPDTDPPFPAWLVRLCGIDVFADVVAVRVPLKTTSDSVLQRVTSLRQLRSLDFRGPGITDSGVAQLSALDRLEHIWLSGSSLTDAGVMHLIRLPRINYLILSRTQISDASVDRLASLPELDVLWVDATRLTPAGIARL